MSQPFWEDRGAQAPPPRLNCKLSKQQDSRLFFMPGKSFEEALRKVSKILQSQNFFGLNLLWTFPLQQMFSKLWKHKAGQDLSQGGEMPSTRCCSRELHSCTHQSPRVKLASVHFSADLYFQTYENIRQGGLFTNGEKVQYKMLPRRASFLYSLKVQELNRTLNIFLATYVFKTMKT